MIFIFYVQMKIQIL